MKLKFLKIKKINMRELTQKDEIIKNLMNDKEILYNEIENLNSKNILIKNIYDKKYQKLKDLVDNIQKEKNEKENESQENYHNQITKFQNEINKYKNVIEIFNKKENKYIEELDELNKIIQNMKEQQNKEINNNNKLYHNYDRQLFYKCDYCNCKHILCKECQNNYLYNK